MAQTVKVMLVTGGECQIPVNTDSSSAVTVRDILNETESGRVAGSSGSYLGYLEQSGTRIGKIQVNAVDADLDYNVRPGDLILISPKIQGGLGR
jgi:hypothetical protein